MSQYKTKTVFLGTVVRKGFEVFTAVVMKSIIFWDMTPCSLLSYNHLRGRRNNFSNTSKQAGGKKNNPPAGKPVYIGTRR
jgi:hypothetical protein